MALEKPRLIRKRLIPFEEVLLDKDEIIFMNDDVIVTRWEALKPKAGFTSGMSCYYINKGWKISKFIDKKGNLVYYYCAIIETCFDRKSNTYVFTDLLADVIIYENGFVKVLDLGEVPDAMDSGVISIELVKSALTRLDKLLCEIYSGKFKELIKDYF